MMLRLLDLTKVFLVFLVFLSIGCTIARCRNSEYLNPDWIDPHDWTGDRDPLQQLCPKTQNCEPCEHSAKSEYLRLVNSFFNLNEFRFDEKTNYLYRTVHIHITKEQMEKLKKSTDPIYMDGLISEVLAQTDFGTIQLVKEYTVDVTSTIWDGMPSLPSLPSLPDMSDINFNALPRSRPILINFTLLVLTFFVCRRFGINYLIVIFFALVYCLYEYLDNECHRRIELNETVEFIYGKEKNPCMSPTRMNWYDWVVGRDSRSACRDFLDRQSVNQNKCNVVDLFYEFAANVLMKQLKLFFATIAEMVHSISTTHGILITAVTLYFMKGLLMTIIQSVFKYILNPTIWSRVAVDINSTQSPESSVPLHRVQNIAEPDLRDENVSKALDLANQQMQYILEHKKIALVSGQPSGVEVLAPKATESEKSTSDISSTMSLEPKGENALANVSHITCSSQSTKAPRTSSDEITESYDEFSDVEIVKTHNVSTLSSESNATISSDGSSSTNLSIQSDGTSMTSDGTKTSTDSMDIFSISSDTTSSS